MSSYNRNFAVYWTKPSPSPPDRQWRSQPDNLVPLYKLSIIIIIHFFRNWLFLRSINTKILHSGTKSSGWLRYCRQVEMKNRTMCEKISDRGVSSPNFVSHLMNWWHGLTEWYFILIAIVCNITLQKLLFTLKKLISLVYYNIHKLLLSHVICCYKEETRAKY